MLAKQKFEKSKSGKTVRYSPPLSEFDMYATSLKSGEKEEVSSVGGPTILIATKGGAKMKVGGKVEHDLKEGQVFFIAHGQTVEFEAGSDGLLAHAAYVE